MQFVRDIIRQKVLLSFTKLLVPGSPELSGWLQGAVLKNMQAACSGWLSCELSVLVAGSWGLDIKGEFESLSRSVIISRGPTYPL